MGGSRTEALGTRRRPRHGISVAAWPGRAKDGSGPGPWGLGAGPGSEAEGHAVTRSDPLIGALFHSTVHARAPGSAARLVTSPDAYGQRGVGRPRRCTKIMHATLLCGQHWL